MGKTLHGERLKLGIATCAVRAGPESMKMRARNWPPTDNNKKITKKRTCRAGNCRYDDWSSQAVFSELNLLNQMLTETALWELLGALLAALAQL